jgi:hypothetical protein
MKFRTRIIGNRIVNCVEQMACFLKHGDVFLRPRSNTQYKFEEFVPDQKLVICENLETHMLDKIFCNSPVFKLTYV